MDNSLKLPADQAWAAMMASIITQPLDIAENKDNIEFETIEFETMKTQEFELPDHLI